MFWGENSEKILTLNSNPIILSVSLYFTAECHNEFGSSSKIFGSSWEIPFGSTQNPAWFTTSAISDSPCHILYVFKLESLGILL